MRLHQLLVRFRIHTLPLREHHLEPSRCHTEQQHTRLRADILEGVRGLARDEDKGAGWYALHTFAKLEVELAAHDVSKLGFHSVQMRGRPAARGDGLAKQAECSPLFARLSPAVRSCPPLCLAARRSGARCRATRLMAPLPQQPQPDRSTIA